MPAFRVTLHAVERYQERVDPTATAACARRAILQAAETAVRLREKTWAGHVLFQGGDPPLRLVVKFDGNGAAGVVATVFPPDSFRKIPLREEELIREYADCLPSIVEAAERKARGEKPPPELRIDKCPLLRGRVVELTEAEAALISLAIRARPSPARVEFMERVPGEGGGRIWRAWIGARPALLVRYSGQLVREAVEDEGQMDG